MRNDDATTGRRPGELERVYFEIFDRFARMIHEGTFPFRGDTAVPEEAPRVGDGGRSHEGTGRDGEAAADPRNPR